MIFPMMGSPERCQNDRLSTDSKSILEITVAFRVCEPIFNDDTFDDRAMLRKYYVEYKC